MITHSPLVIIEKLNAVLYIPTYHLESYKIFSLYATIMRGSNFMRAKSMPEAIEISREEMRKHTLG